MMKSMLSSLYDDAENRYLNTETLTGLNHYVKSVPLRVATYRALRDNEIKIMQVVADRLETEFASLHTAEQVEQVEKTITHGLLVMRHSAIALLMDDPEYLETRLLNWLRETMAIEATGPIDAALFRYLRQILAKAMNPQQLALLDPLLVMAQKSLIPA
jgi:hypothetical protein